MENIIIDNVKEKNANVVNDISSIKENIEMKEKGILNVENYLDNVEFVRENNLIPEMVFVDGVGRSGKCIFAHIISSFERVEKQHNLDLFEWVGILWRAKKITTDAAIALLRVEGDTRLYNAYICRDVNFRFTDDSGIFKNADPWRYIKRLFVKPREDAVDKIVRERPIMQTGMHDGLRNAQFFFEAFKKRLKIIYVIRDPVQLIFQWHQGGFAHSVGTRLREFQLAIKCKDKAIPYSVIGWGEEFLTLGTYDRLIRLINNHFELNLDNYFRIDEEMRKNVIIVTFEEIVTNPFPLCEKVATFLGTKTTRWTKKILKKEKCPRYQDPKERERQIQEIEKNATPKYVEVFHKLLKRYESRFWEVRS